MEIYASILLGMHIVLIVLADNSRGLTVSMLNMALYLPLILRILGAI